MVSVDRVVIGFFESSQQRELISIRSTEAQNANMNFGLADQEIDDDFGEALADTTEVFDLFHAVVPPGFCAQKFENGDDLGTIRST
jgi:hypothetical protein